MMKLFLHDSVAMHLGEIIDCRYLTLAMEYHDLDITQTKALVLDALEFIACQLGDDLICAWKINNRSMSMKSMRQWVDTVLEKGASGIHFEAYRKSEKISTQQQIRLWNNYLRREASLTIRPHSGWSVDFADYWNKRILPYAKDKPALKQALVQMFQEPGRYLQSVCWTPDVDGAIFPGGFDERNGRILFSVSSYALGEELEKTAQHWKEILIAFAEKYRNLDGRVMLQPKVMTYGSPHMSYFDDGRKDCEGLPGVEWANVLSPQAQEWLTWTVEQVPQSEGIQCAQLAGGGLLLASRKAVKDYDVADALQLKMLIKDALYPGPGIGYALSVIMRPVTPGQSNTHFPRANWAVVPILEEEIQIVESMLRFEASTMS